MRFFALYIYGILMRIGRREGGLGALGEPKLPEGWRKGAGRGILVVARPRDPKEVSHAPTRLIDIYGPGGREERKVEEKEIRGEPGGVGKGRRQRGKGF